MFVSDLRVQCIQSFGRSVDSEFKIRKSALDGRFFELICLDCGNIVACGPSKQQLERVGTAHKCGSGNKSPKDS